MYLLVKTKSAEWNYFPYFVPFVKKYGIYYNNIYEALQSRFLLPGVVFPDNF
jgi:hypothetical protein